MNLHYQQQLYLRPSFIAFFNFSSKWPTFAFTGESGYTLAFAQRIAHNGTHAETGAFRTGPLSLPSTRTARSRTSPGRVSERQTLPLLGFGRVCSRRTQKAYGQRCAYARRCPVGIAAPLGCVILFLLSKLWLVCYALRVFPRVRDMGGITTLGVLCVLPKRRTATCQSG